MIKNDKKRIRPEGTIPILLINNEKTINTINQLIRNDIPIIPRIIKDQVCLDLRSVFHNQDDIIVQALNNS